MDHKKIGKRYLATAFLFLLLGGLEAAVMRAQLARPDQHLLTPEAYNQLFSMHGITMIFLYASPILSGFSNYIWPLILGSRDMAFPRLNAFSYWVFLVSGIFLYSSFLIGQAPDRGWFAYAPMTGSTLLARAAHGLLRARADPAHDLDDRGGHQLHHRRCSGCARRACRSTGCRSSCGAR